MTKRKYERRAHLTRPLVGLGFRESEVEILRRASNALQRWFERECNGEIQRNEETGVPLRYREGRYLDPHDPRQFSRIPDRETSARKRIDTIVRAHPKLSYYIQTDPRGASLYILRPGDVPARKSVEST